MSEHSFCRSCGNKLFEVVNFGKMPIANAFVHKEQFKKEYMFQLMAMNCPRCSLFQLYEQPDPSLLFHDNYAFLADTSRVMQQHFSLLAEELIKDFNLKNDELVTEIGSNDSGVIYYLNKSYKHTNHLGVEPSKNVCEISNSKGLRMKNLFFNSNTASNLISEFGKSKYFISLNTLAHIPDINSVLKGIHDFLTDDGIYITEDPYLFDVFNKVSYDQIYDEHVFIFSVTAMKNLCDKFNLQLFDVKKTDTAGGSMRYYITKNKTTKISRNLVSYLDFEKKNGIFETKIYSTFRKNCEKSKNSLLDTLTTLAEKNNKIVSYGATSKSTTIFNYCNIGTDLISFITDTTSTKINKYSPGVHIPIYDYEYFLNNLPNYCFLGAWNHRKEISIKEKEIFSKKGKWIIHTPEAKIINDL